jgi:hypothetical protein
MQPPRGPNHFKRRVLLRLAGAVTLGKSFLRGESQAMAAATLLSAPLDVEGDWADSPVAAARTVITRMRQACLAGIRLLSDRQPQKLRVDDQRSGPPHIWLHEENPDTAWIVVHVGTRAWSQLAYQFGHELGHVLCNSWAGAQFEPPCRWLEEAMVEAFSIRGLGALAAEWQRDPPFPNDNAYGASIGKYRDDLVAKYRDAAGDTPVGDLAAWFRANRAALDGAHGLGMVEGPGIAAIAGELERDQGCVEDLGAVNRWPQRSAVPIEEYLRLWQASCREIKTPGHLPLRLAELFGLPQPM